MRPRWTIRALALDRWFTASAERVAALPKASAWLTACAGLVLVASENKARPLPSQCFTARFTSANWVVWSWLAIAAPDSLAAASFSWPMS